MKLRRPCQHGKYDSHVVSNEGTRELGEMVVYYEPCPGGVFLPDDALVIEKVDGEWPEWATLIIRQREGAAFATLDALCDREAE